MTDADTASPGSDASRQPDADQKLVVIVDDDVTVRRWMGRALQQCGYRIHEAEDGTEVAALVSRLRPHCLVLDLAMPGKDGLETLAELRDVRHSSRVVVVSGLDWAGSLLQAARLLGANVALSKPFDLRTLLGAISPG